MTSWFARHLMLLVPMLLGVASLLLFLVVCTVDRRRRSVRCPYCTSLNPSPARFCRNCGKAVG